MLNPPHATLTPKPVGVHRSLCINTESEWTLAKANVDAPSSTTSSDFPLFLKSNSNPSPQGSELCSSLQADHVPLSFIHSGMLGILARTRQAGSSQGAGTAALSSATLCRRAFAQAILSFWNIPLVGDPETSSTFRSRLRGCLFQEISSKLIRVGPSIPHPCHLIQLSALGLLFFILMPVCNYFLSLFLICALPPTKEGNELFNRS